MLQILEHMKNTFVAFLELLNVKLTKSFSDQYFNKHPHKNNLFRLSNMLSYYDVENAGGHIKDKEQNLSEINTPFIDHFKGDFVVVFKIEADNISFIWKVNKHVLTVDKFIKFWTGIVVLADSSEKFTLQ